MNPSIEILQIIDNIKDMQCQIDTLSRIQNEEWDKLKELVEDGGKNNE